MIAPAHRPTAQFAAAEQVVERRHQLAIVLDLEIASVDERSVDDLPAGLILGVQVPIVVSEFDRAIDAISQLLVAGQFGLLEFRHRLVATADKSSDENQQNQDRPT